MLRSIYIEYMGKDKEKNAAVIEKEIDRNLSAKKVILGDFNARIGREIGSEIIGYKCVRNVKDKEKNSDGNKMIEWLKENGLIVLNGCKLGDVLGEFTYIGNGETTIDYGLVDRETWEKVKEFRIEERIDSDHMPMGIFLLLGSLLF